MPGFSVFWAVSSDGTAPLEAVAFFMQKPLLENNNQPQEILTTMKTQIIPKSWRDSLGDLREDLSHTVDRWLGRLKPEERDEAARELQGFDWPRSIDRLFNQPRIDIDEHEDEIVVRAELPGLKKEDIEVDLDDRLLTIYGKREETRERKRGRAHVSEMHFGSVTRTIPLPCEVDRSKVKAKYRHGVLRLSLPKSEEAKARRIPIDYEDE